MFIHFTPGSEPAPRRLPAVMATTSFACPAAATNLGFLRHVEDAADGLRIEQYLR